MSLDNTTILVLFCNKDLQKLKKQNKQEESLT